MTVKKVECKDSAAATITGAAAAVLTVSSAKCVAWPSDTVGVIEVWAGWQVLDIHGYFGTVRQVALVYKSGSTLTLSNLAPGTIVRAGGGAYYESGSPTPYIVLSGSDFVFQAPAVRIETSPGSGIYAYHDTLWRAQSRLFKEHTS